MIGGGGWLCGVAHKRLVVGARVESLRIHTYIDIFESVGFWGNPENPGASVEPRRWRILALIAGGNPALIGIWHSGKSRRVAGVSLEFPASFFSVGRWSS